MILREKFSPTCFLSALGAGGLSVSFFMYLMFLVPHPTTPMATYDYIMPALLKADWLSFVISFSLVFIIAFAFLHFKLLIWNTKQYNLYKKTDAYKSLINSNAQISLMTLPLTYAMTINVCFVLGAVFIPGLWGVVEFLFPFALIGFIVVGYFALKIFFEYFSRLLTTGDFDFTKNNNLSQMISIFALSMIAVGFAAPGAMSHNIIVNSIGIFGALFFASLAILLMLIKLTIGFKSMLEQGLNLEAAPSIWIIIPILTLLGITFIRVSFGLDHNYNTPLNKSSLFVFTSFVLSLQIIFGILGYMVMKKIGYFEKFIESNEKSALSFALICPGVAFFVFGMFFVNFGLSFNAIVAKYSIAYFILMIPFIYIQIKTVIYFFKLYKKFSF
ncbi:TsoY family (seleno)protein [Arcobacter aquimarinus]|uniref:TsoY family (seleno)protein n=1 Tax=Arcobacter aquimarinus TaxID=1315211 RepID=UPI003BB0DFDE